jgi:hypothetical protein
MFTLFKLIVIAMHDDRFMYNSHTIFLRSLEDGLAQMWEGVY